MKKRHAFTLFLALCMVVSLLSVGLTGQDSAQAAAAYHTIRVKISTAENASISITVGPNYRIKESPATVLPSGEYTVRYSSGKIRIYGGSVDVTGGSSLTLERCQNDGLNTISLYNTRYRCSISYLGDMTFCAEGSGVRVINTVPIEQYLYGVVGYEMSNSFPLEALKAQAVVARGYAIRALRSSSYSYDIGDTSSDQVYRGYPGGQSYVKAAVEATAGQVMTYNGEICCTYFAASNGGQIELPGNAWGGGDAKNAAYPYLAQKDDPYDLANPSSLSYRLYVPKVIRNTSMDPVPDLVGTGIGYTVRIVNVNNNCSVYASASSSATRIGVADKDAVYAWIADSGDYYKIDFNGTSGYVKKTYAIKIPEEGAAITGDLPALPILYGDISPVLEDLQAQAYAVMAARGDSVPDKTNIRLLQCTDFRNGQPRYTTGDSRCYVTAEADLIVQFVDNEGSLVDNVEVTASITLMNKVDGSYVLSHDYLSANCRMRLIEPVSDGFDIVNRRYGHGIGMSQRGAQQMALNGKDYGFILTFYYTDATVSTVDTTIPDLPTITTEQVVRIVLSNPDSYVNIRSQPSSSSTKIGKGYHNETYGYLGKTGSWWKINYKGQTGYVYSTYGALKTVSATPAPSSTATPDATPTPTPTATPAMAQMIRIKLSDTSSTVNIRSQASTSSTKIGKGYHNETYGYLGKTGSWWKIDYKGQTGYVYSTYGELVTVSATPTPSATPTSTVTPTPTATPTPTTTPTVTPTPTPTSTPTPTPAQMVRIQLSNTSSYVNIRSKASTSSTKLGKGYHNEQYTYRGKTGSWWIIDYKGKTGYVYATYGTLAGSPSTPTPAPSSTTTKIIRIKLSNTSSTVNVRSQASTSSSKLGTARHGKTYSYLGKSGSWWKIDFNGKTGYVYSRYGVLETVGASASSTPAPTASPSVGATGNAVQIKLSNTSSYVNIRSSASTSAGKLGTAKHNAIYGYLGSSGSWYKIQYGDKVGYVYGSYAQRITANAMVRIRLSNTASLLNVRSGASTGTTRIGSAKHNDTYVCLGSSGDWYQIQFGSKQGYVLNQYATLYYQAP